MAFSVRLADWRGSDRPVVLEETRPGETGVDHCLTPREAAELATGLAEALAQLGAQGHAVEAFAPVILARGGVLLVLDDRPVADDALRQALAHGLTPSLSANLRQRSTGRVIVRASGGPVERVWSYDWPGPRRKQGTLRAFLRACDLSYVAGKMGADRCFYPDGAAARARHLILEARRERRIRSKDDAREIWDMYTSDPF